MKCKSFPHYRLTLVLSVIIAFILFQSLFFKFTDAPETQFIFGSIDSWATSFGLPSGLFLGWGPFSAIAVGIVELIASLLLLFGCSAKNPLGTVAGALVAVAATGGALFFHTVGPLGLVVQDDGGLLFGMACFVFFGSLFLVYLQRNAVLHYVR